MKTLIVLNVRPLLPKRENRLSSHIISYDWISQTIFSEFQNVRLLFPLPGGEGQGEGGRNN
jgi:hypothetical protein